MGPYCKFCKHRCFTFIPMDTPRDILDVYSTGVTIIATCPEGQRFEKKKLGYCYDDILAERRLK